MKVKDLNPADYNPRKISDEKLSILLESMQSFGDLSGVVVNVRTGRMVGGHQRIKNFDPDWKIVKKPSKDSTGTVSAGHIETPSGRWVYREVDWTEEKEKAANLAANKHGGEWDLKKLDDIIGDLKAVDYDIELTGFSLSEVNRLEKHNSGDGDGDGVPNLDGYIYQVVVTVSDETAPVV